MRILRIFEDIDDDAFDDYHEDEGYFGNEDPLKLPIVSILVYHIRMKMI